MELPKDFIERTKILLGTDEYLQFEASLSADAPISIRMNRDKSDFSPNTATVQWCEEGYYLPERIPFTFDPLFHAGTYYVQEASSMFLGHVVRHFVQEPSVILDLCAAPGGKSTHLLSAMPKGSLLVSNEVIRSRCNILAENIAKWGNPNHIVTNNDPKEIGKLTRFFDVIVADVPCSGEGMFRKDNESINEWTTENVMLCAARCRRILNDIWNALKPGGVFILSTCTFNTEENEENVKYAIEELGASPIEIPVNQEWKITPALKYNYPAYHFFPHKTKGEGFFLAAFRKADSENQTFHLKNNKKNRQKERAQTPASNDWQRYLSDADSYIAEWHNFCLRAIPAIFREKYQLLKSQLTVVDAGIYVGEQKGKDFIPSEELALSTALNRTAFQETKLSYADAIRYLKKEAFPLPGDTEKGYILVTYENIPLGFMKNIGNRANNLYPQEWRIRSSFCPEQTKTLSNFR